MDSSDNLTGRRQGEREKSGWGEGRAMINVGDGV